MSNNYPVSKKNKLGSIAVYDPDEIVTHLGDRAVTISNIAKAVENFVKDVPSESDNVATKIAVNAAGVVTEIIIPTAEDVPNHNHTSTAQGGVLPSATETTKGIIELATVAEATTGNDTTRAVTPAGLKAAVPDSITLTGAVTGTVNLGGAGNTISTSRKAALVGWFGQTNNVNVWFKVFSSPVPSSTDDRGILLAFQKPYDTVSEFGILHCHIRGATSLTCYWQYATSAINPNNYILCSNGTVFELWAKFTAGWEDTSVVVIDETQGSWTVNRGNIFTVSNNNTGVADIPAEFTTRLTSVINQVNPTSLTANLTAGTAANTLPTAGTNTIIKTLLEQIRNCLAWLVSKFNASGVVNVANGGTGQTTLALARNSMGLGNTIGALPVENGGTGKTTVQGVVQMLYAPGGSRSGVSGSSLHTFAFESSGANPGYLTLQALRERQGLGNTLGALPIANGGTGQTTAALARNALGLGNTTGALPIANGGTGATTAADARTNLGISTKVDIVHQYDLLISSAAMKTNQTNSISVSGDKAYWYGNNGTLTAMYVSAVSGSGTANLQLIINGTAVGTAVSVGTGITSITLNNAIAKGNSIEISRTGTAGGTFGNVRVMLLISVSYPLS